MDQGLPATHAKLEEGSRAEAHEDLFDRLMAWRASEAQKLRLAPVVVLPDHLAMAIVKVKPVEADALQAIGVRLAGAAELLALIEKWYSFISKSEIWHSRDPRLRGTLVRKFEWRLRAISAHNVSIRVTVNFNKNATN